MASRLKIARTATLPEILALLVRHGPKALMAAEGIESHAQGLAFGHLTIWPHEQTRYGKPEAWTAWESLREKHGPQLKEMATQHEAYVARANEEKIKRMTSRSTGSMGEDWFDEENVGKLAADVDKLLK